MFSKENNLCNMKNDIVCWLSLASTTVKCLFSFGNVNVRFFC
jgi:hypothetical protein